MGVSACLGVQKEPGSQANAIKSLHQDGPSGRGRKRSSSKRGSKAGNTQKTSKGEKP